MGEPMARYVVYGLTDPRDGHVFYVGMTDQHPSTRLFLHLNDRSNEPKAEYIDALRKISLEPGYTTLQVCPDKKSAAVAETWWIATGNMLGWPLTNKAKSVIRIAKPTAPKMPRHRQHTQAARRVIDNLGGGEVSEPKDASGIPLRVAIVFGNHYDPSTGDLKRGGRAKVKEVMFDPVAISGRAATIQAQEVTAALAKWMAFHHPAQPAENG